MDALHPSQLGVISRLTDRVRLRRTMTREEVEEEEENATVTKRSR